MTDPVLSRLLNRKSTAPRTQLTPALTDHRGGRKRSRANRAIVRESMDHCRVSLEAGGKVSPKSCKRSQSMATI